MHRDNPYLNDDESALSTNMSGAGRFDVETHNIDKGQTGGIEDRATLRDAPNWHAKPGDASWIGAQPAVRTVPPDQLQYNPSVCSRLPELTAREVEVAIALAHGDGCQEIAIKLGISVKTIDTHRSHVLKKLGCRNAVDLCRLAIRRGVVLP